VDEQGVHWPWRGGRRSGGYDDYAYVEDDLIARDPWLFVRLG
jgi:hypothetical protein